MFHMNFPRHNAKQKKKSVRAWERKKSDSYSYVCLHTAVRFKNKNLSLIWLKFIHIFFMMMKSDFSKEHTDYL